MPVDLQLLSQVQAGIDGTALAIRELALQPRFWGNGNPAAERAGPFQVVKVGGQTAFSGCSL